MSPQQEARIAEALRHVEIGFAAMSVWSTDDRGTCKCVKGKDCVSPGKHPIPIKGFLEASTNPDTVRRMLAAGSEPNYGIVWPENSDRILVIIDVDGADWAKRIADLKAKFGPLPATKTTRTPSGGLHLFYWWPDGVPVPEGNTLHGFVVRFPWKGYVVGPGSRINGKVYRPTGSAEIATLPKAWTEIAPISGRSPLITVVGETPGYEMPDSVATGHRHDEIARLVASLWNKRVPKAMVETLVRDLAKRFVEPMDEARLLHEITESYDTAERKWREPGGTSLPPSGGEKSGGVAGEIVIDPLAIESRIERPEPLDIDAIALPVGLIGLMDHYRPLCDAPFSSLLLASVVTMSALVGPKPTLNYRGTNRAILFGVLVGEANYGRKGAAMRVVDQAFRQVDPLLPQITKGGIASPEKLIALLAESKQNALGSLLIREMELRSVLTIASREGNNMSPAIRQVWDGDRVESHSIQRGSVSADGYHAAFLAGTTPMDLTKALTADDVANGWANRFLWFHSEPRRDAAFNPTADDTMSQSLRDWLAECIEFARRLGGSALIAPRYTMAFSDEALSRMEATVKRLDVPPVGAMGALRQRMPVHAIRLAMIAAIFRKSAVVEVEDLLFGEALTDYALDSMRSVFGTRIDDEVAKTILDILRQAPDGWLNTSTIASAIRKDGSRTNRALTVLLDSGLVEREDRRTAGRTAIGYHLRAS